MKRAFLCLVLALIFASSFLPTRPVIAQKDKKITPTGPLLTRTTNRHESFRFGYAGTITIAGPPAGSIIIEGWTRNEVDVSAAIELRAPTAADLDQLAAVNSFFVDQDVNHLRILTTGTHDKNFMKKTAKNFPKNLIGLPWKIDYVIKVPEMTQLDIDAGVGPLKISGVEGAMRVNALSSDAELSMTGGLVAVTVQSGSVNFRVPARGWHGLGAEVKLASGNLTVELMPGFSADIHADVLRIGEVKNGYPELSPLGTNSISPRSITARAGSGGATLSFTVGDGTIQILQARQ
jgi:hypothetical protein